MAWRKQVFAVFQIGITAIALVYIFQYVSLTNILRHLVLINSGTLLICFLLSALPIPLLVYRWNAVLTCLDARVPRDHLIRGVLLERFFSQVLPTAIGGDVARAAVLLGKGAMASTTLMSIALDRIAGLLSLIALGGVFALVAAFAYGPSDISGGAVAVALAALIVAGGIASVPRGWMARIGGNRLAVWLGGLLTSMHAVLGQRRFYVMAIGISCVGQVMFCLVLALLAKDEFGSVPVLGVAVLAPLVFLSGAIPLTIGGWGVREGAAVLVFQAIGLTSRQAIDLSVQFGIVQLLVGVVSAFAVLVFAAVSPQTMDVRS